MAVIEIKGHYFDNGEPLEIDEEFGHLTVLSNQGNLYELHCDCGNDFVIPKNRFIGREYFIACGTLRCKFREEFETKERLAMRKHPFGKEISTAAAEEKRKEVKKSHTAYLPLDILHRVYGYSKKKNLSYSQANAKIMEAGLSILEDEGE